jgi:hypothetical protein
MIEVGIPPSLASKMAHVTVCFELVEGVGDIKEVK